MKPSIICVLSIILNFSTLSAQDIAPVSDLFVNVDYSIFKNRDKTNYLEIYYGIYPGMLHYKTMPDDKIQGGIFISTKILTDDGSTIVNGTTFPIQISETDTTDAWFRYPMVTQAGFNLAPGDYQLSIIVSDSLNSARVDSTLIPFSLEDVGTELTMSDIQLAKKITPSTKTGDLFFKNSLEVIPIPTLVFGLATTPVLFHYAEIYNIKPGTRYKLKTSLLNMAGEPVKETSQFRVFKNATGIIVGTTPVTSYPTGKYVLRCEIQTKLGKTLLLSDKKLNILNPHIKNQKSESAAAILAQLQNATEQELRDEFEVAKYVASEADKNMFKTITDANIMREFLSEFWPRAKSPTAETADEIIGRKVYLRRVEVANEQFSIFSKKGWKTDRGRVFIVYGPPSDIQRNPAQDNEIASQTWTYFDIEGGVVFVFLDESGYSEYRLVHSTKRGELADSRWQDKSR